MRRMKVRMLTKAEACRELKLSLSTLNRRIAAGEVAATREPRGRRHRVYVMLDDDPLGNDGNVGSGDTAMVVAQERIRGLEERIALLEEHLAQERRRNAELVNRLQDVATTTSGIRKRPWRLGWQQRR